MQESTRNLLRFLLAGPRLLGPRPSEASRDDHRPEGAAREPRAPHDGGGVAPMN